MTEAIDSPERRSQVVRNRIAERFQFLVGAYQARIGLGQLFSVQFECLFDLLALGDITNRTGDQRAFRSFQRAETDLDWEFRAVLAPAKELESRAHRAHFRILEEPFTVTWMSSLESFRKQHFYFMIQQFLAGITEPLFGLRVGKDDHALAVHDHHRIRRGLQKAPKFFFCSLALGYVSDGA